MTEPEPTASILERLKRIPDQADVALVLRHAERHAITPGSFGVDVSLTKVGTVLAERLGALLSERTPGRIACSPVLRCMQTADAILRGSRWSATLRYDRTLGDHGPFVVDPKIAGQLFFEVGVHELVRRQLVELEPLPGMRSTRDGVQLLLGRVADGLGNQERLDIHITHDAILAVLVAWLSARPVEEIEWPDYLDGLLLWRFEGNLFFSWRGLEEASHPTGS